MPKIKESKYEGLVRYAIDTFWRDNHFPPTIRDLMEACDIHSSSHVHDILRSMSDDIRLARDGRPIPGWVDRLFDSNLVIWPLDK